ncbi:MAG: hypothetical protein IJS61_11265, partial [Firmicutes bacterium]|nr:hypothetical protein [Bacillota bacterium]
MFLRSIILYFNFFQNDGTTRIGTFAAQKSGYRLPASIFAVHVSTFATQKSGYRLPASIFAVHVSTFATQKSGYR